MMEWDNSLKLNLSSWNQEFKCSIFSVHRATVNPVNGSQTLNVFKLHLADWVNVVPMTSSGQLILVEQHRFGSNTLTLETPGGAVESSEKDVTVAAQRELEEETGYSSQRLVALPSFLPNPAIQQNKITFFLAMNCVPLAKPLDHEDPFEQVKVHLVDFKEACHWVRTGQIKHSLAALGILLAEPYLNSQSS
jgi:ADP-ribose pyrophosphatase